MIALLDPLTRATVLLALGLIVAFWLARHSAAWRHALVATSLGAATLVPLLGALLPAWPVPMPTRTSATVERHAATAAAVNQHQTPTAATRLSTDGSRSSPTRQTLLGPLLIGVWACGAVLSLGVLAGTFFKMQAVAANGRPLDDERWQRLLRQGASLVGHRGEVGLRAVESAHVPAAWGIGQSQILLPHDAVAWGDDRVRVVLAHELAHVARRDWLIQLCAETLRALCWWHPLVWLAARQLRRDSELACDDRVVAGGIPPCDYASHLIAVARTRLRPSDRWTGVVAMAHQPFLERRIRLMLTSHQARALTSRHVVALSAVAVLLAGALAAVRAQPTPTELHGTVFDSSGAVVPQVALTLVRGDDSRVEVSTGSDGSFSFPSVAPGAYTLEARLPGFASLSEAFTLTTASDWDRAITLQLGTLRETISIVAERTASPSPQTADAPAPLRVGGNIRVPRKLKDVRAVYPPAMRAEGREGEVQLEAIIDGEGAVKAVRVLGAHVHPDFALAAADAVRQWQFSPTLLNGAPVEVLMNVTMSFTLDNGGG